MVDGKQRPTSHFISAGPPGYPAAAAPSLVPQMVLCPYMGPVLEYVDLTKDDEA
jgi:hypothetical protein